MNLKILRSKVFFQKKIYFLLLVLISLFFLFPLLNNSFYITHDGEAQIARFGAYIKGFLDQQFPIRWAGDLNYRYGSPVLNFYYPLPGFISIPLYFLGFSLENIFKLIISFSFILSFVTFYLWTREFLKKEAAFFGALLYGLSPYHFLNLYVRGDLAELLAFSFVPLVFFFIDKTIKKRFPNLIWGSVFYALIILSHNSVALIFSPVFLLYAFMKTKNKDRFISICILFLGGLAISAFFWIPAVFELRFTNAHLFIGDNFKNHFLSLSKIIFSQWGFGPDVNRLGGLSPQIGIIGSGIIIYSLFQAIKDRKNLFWTSVLLLSIFMTLSISTTIWDVLPSLKFLEFPWRILGLSSFAVAVLGALIFNKIDKKWIAVLSFFLILSSIIYIKINHTPSKQNVFYFNYVGTTYYHGEASSVWTAGDFSALPKDKLEIISGKGQIGTIKKKSNSHEFSVKAKTYLSLLDNTVYFPGWIAVVDGNDIPIEFQDPNHKGLITFRIPPGVHKVSVRFTETKLRMVSDIISVIAILSALGILSRRRIGLK